MNLKELKAAAEAAEWGKSSMHIHPATILKLIAVLQLQHEALKKNMDFMETPVEERKVMPWTDTYDAIVALKELNDDI